MNGICNQRLHRSVKRLTTAGVIAGMVWATGGLTAQAAADQRPRMAQAFTKDHALVATLAAGVGTSDAKDQEMTVPAGHSSLIKAPWLVKQVSVANADVADVQVVSPRQVLIVGKKVGSTDLTLWSDDGQVWQTRIYVEVDLVQISRDLSRFLPGSRIKLAQSQDVVVVTGSLRRAEQTSSLHRFLDATGMKYVDMTTVSGVHQVMIQVRVAEASREAIRVLGINAFHTNEGFVGGSLVDGNSNNLNIGVANGVRAGSNLPFTFNTPTSVGSAVTLFTGFPDLDLQLFLEALADNQYIRVLAEPSLVAMTGQEASFLAGGEFPIPVVQGTTAGAGSTITIEYKEFGVRLRFRPTVLGDSTIRLHLAPEVSDLSDVGAVALEGFRIPSLLTRRAETTLEMKSGQTFAIAGLIDHNVTARTQKIPGLGDIPILGSLFRSVRYERGDTELVVLATVSLVEPMDADPKDLPVPGAAHVMPDDWQLYAKGKIEGQVPLTISTTTTRWLEKRGLNRLKGPGAWTTHLQPAIPTPTRRPLPTLQNSSTLDQKK